jgi:hypothetical protein
MSQNLARLYFFSTAKTRGSYQPPSIAATSVGSGENGKRYQLHQPASTALDHACRTYPYNPTIEFRTLAPSRLQQRCNLDRSKNGAYTFFPLNLQFGEASGDAPV